MIVKLKRWAGYALLILIFITGSALLAIVSLGAVVLLCLTFLVFFPVIEWTAKQ